MDHGAGACAPAFSLITKEVYHRDHSERMNENRTYEYAYANHQRQKDRELVILRHLLQHHILAHHRFTMRWIWTNNIRTAIFRAAPMDSSNGSRLYDNRIGLASNRDR